MSTTVDAIATRGFGTPNDTIDAIATFGFGIGYVIPIPPVRRTYTITAESRIMEIGVENHIMDIGLENRTLVVE